MNIKKLIGILIILISMTACNQAREKKTKTEYSEGWKPLIENNYSISYPDDWELDQSELMGSNFILFSPLTSTKISLKRTSTLSFKI